MSRRRGASAIAKGSTDAAPADLPATRTLREEVAEDKARYLRSFLSPQDDERTPPGARRPQDDMSGGGTDDDVPKVVAKEDQAKRMKSFRTRTVSTVVMLGGFVCIVWAGHVPVMFFVLMLQILIVREAFGLGRMAQEELKLPWFRAQQWYFFAVSTAYLYLSFISSNLMVEVTVSSRSLALLLVWAVKRHLIVCFFGYCAGFVMFVLSLKRGMYLYQFAQYAWTHMIIFMVILPTSFFVSNTFQGIVWYLLPAMLIVANDIFAYLAGFFFGRTPLIKLSPKKTWEGFIGALLGTGVFAFYISRLLASSKWLTCPRHDLSLGPLECEPSAIFFDRAFTTQELAAEMPGPLEELLVGLHLVLPTPAWEWLASRTFTVMPIQLHALVMSFFASLISPFGGFFASGFKRAFKLKDFGDTIPGHGGLTDRFDCQVLMAVFSYLYYWNYIQASSRSVGDLLTDAAQLSPAKQIELLFRLHNLLVGEGLLPEGSAPTELLLRLHNLLGGEG